MNWSTDQILFYGGALLALAAVVWLAAALLHYRIAAKRLDAQLEAEYGKPPRTGA